MVDRQVHAEPEAGLIPVSGQKSVYSVLATYFNNAEKNGLYVKGFVDGEDTFQSFMCEFNAVCKTKFIIRTSWRKNASALPRRSRYGKEERIYWEYNSGNLEVPFTGVPFVVRSCLTKHCQYGSHYYKTTAERVSKQYLDHQVDPTLPLPEVKKRRNKPSKKRNCPAIMHVREVVLFPDFALDMERMFDTKYHVRQEKSQLLLKLKEALGHGESLPSSIRQTQRFYINLPLPEVHIGHPQPCGGISPTIHPSVTGKIDELLSMGIYDARHVRIIVHDFVKEVLLKRGDTHAYHYNVVLYPSEHDIADYIYMSSITAKPTVIVENDCYQTDTRGIKGEMAGSINELMGLLQSCQNPEALAEVKDGMKRIIKTVKNKTAPDGSSQKKKRKVAHKTNDENVTELVNIIDMDEPDMDNLTEVVIFHQKSLDEENG
ncbi:calcium-responsive transcription factor-like [Clavelina lepadiformis]|uniref:Uncharacterized protein n=1 Tax=Clavelina lepadiformis TaxID=159417 RepID=A0ABP0H0R5_CLALP